MPRFHANVLEDIYGTGLFQKVLLFLCSFTSLFQAFEYQSVIFLNYTPKFSCVDPALKNFSQVHWISRTDYSALHDAVKAQTPFHMAKDDNQCWAAVQNPEKAFVDVFACSSWEFDTGVMRRTLVTDYTLICDNEIYQRYLGSCVFFGLALGNFIAMFTDRICRRKLFLSYLAWEIFISIALPFANSLPTMFCLRILRMLSCPVNIVGISLIQETIPTRKRASYGNMYWLPFAIGYCGAAGLAYQTRDWFYFRIYALAGLVLYIPIFFIVPESPRWLTVRGKYDEFGKIIEKVARWNKVTLPPAYISEAVSDIVLAHSMSRLDSSMSNAVPFDGKVSDTICDAFRMPVLRTRMMAMCVYLSSVALCYYGLCTGGKLASDDLFMNVVLLGVVEAPAPLLGWALAELFTRRNVQLLLNLFTAVCVAVSPLVRPHHAVTSAAIMMLGKLASTIVLTIADFYLGECYPTTIRNMGQFFTLAVTCIVSTQAPFIDELQHVQLFWPGLAYAFILLVGTSFLFVFLPETKYCPLAQTIKQSEGLVRGKEEQWLRTINNMPSSRMST